MKELENTVVHLPTWEAFIEYMEMREKTEGKRQEESAHRWFCLWSHLGKTTCATVCDEIRYSRKEYYEEEGYTIITLKQLKEMNKKDLQPIPKELREQGVRWVRASRQRGVWEKRLLFSKDDWGRFFCVQSCDVDQFLGRKTNEPLIGVYYHMQEIEQPKEEEKHNFKIGDKVLVLNKWRVAEVLKKNGWGDHEIKRFITKNRFNFDLSGVITKFKNDKKITAYIDIGQRTLIISRFWNLVKPYPVEPEQPKEECKTLYTAESFPPWAVWIRGKNMTRYKTAIISVTPRGVESWENDESDRLVLFSETDEYEIAGTDGIFKPFYQEI